MPTPFEIEIMLIISSWKTYNFILIVCFYCFKKLYTTKLQTITREKNALPQESKYKIYQTTIKIILLTLEVDTLNFTNSIQIV